MKPASRAHDVKLRRDIAGDAHARAAFGCLLRKVFGPDIKPAPLGGAWTPLAFFTPAGRCVAGLEIGQLPLLLDNDIRGAAAIRSAATDPDWRGRGLFRRLMETALECAETDSNALTLLYTETPLLYERFGFHLVPQHAFAGPLTASSASSTARRLAWADSEDRRLVSEIVARRTPVSSRCALMVDTPVFVAKIAKDQALRLIYQPTDEVLVICEQDGDQIVIVDVVAPRMPTFARLMQIIAPQATRAMCLFPPDKLGWDGMPIAIDTGLMIRGAIPPAMRQPFMFSPTSEF